MAGWRGSPGARPARGPRRRCRVDLVGCVHSRIGTSGCRALSSALLTARRWWPGAQDAARPDSWTICTRLPRTWVGIRRHPAGFEPSITGRRTVVEQPVCPCSCTASWALTSAWVCPGTQDTITRGETTRPVHELRAAWRSLGNRESVVASVLCAAASYPSGSPRW